jgi:uncharacterized protein YkwD
MAQWRILTVTAATGLCVFGLGLPAAHADTAPVRSGLVRTAKSAPWKTAMTRVRVAPAAAPVATVTAPVAVAPAVAPVAAPVEAAPAVVATVADPAVSFAARIVTLLNVERAAAGLKPLAVSTCATGFAATWSRHMASAGDFSHQSLAPMMTSCVARGAGENIAYGGTSPEQFMTMWMNSAGHKANILRSTFTHVGVAVAQTSGGTWYATQDFLTI